MRKILFTLLCAATTLQATAQDQYLVERSSEYTQNKYRFNSHNLLDSLWQCDPYNYIDHYDLYFYDGDDVLTNIDGYQMLNGSADYVKTSYLIFERNDKRQITSRTNFNWFVSQQNFQEGGRMEYTYRDDGQLDYVVTKFRDFNGSYFDAQFDSYTYDGLGRLTQLSIESVDFEDPSVKYPVIREDWTYDGDSDRPLTMRHWDLQEDITPVEKSKSEYVYDEYGNVLEKNDYSCSKSGAYHLEQSYKYTYDYGTTTERVHYPQDFDVPEMVWQRAKHKILTQEWWTINDNDDSFVHALTYIYTYDGKGSSGITRLVADNNLLKVRFSDDKSRITILTGGKMAQGKVQIFTLGGYMAVSAQADSGAIDISHLGRGTYILSVGGKKVKFVK